MTDPAPSPGLHIHRSVKVTGQLVREMHRELMHATFLPSMVDARLLQACLARPGRDVMIIPPRRQVDYHQFMVYQREGGVAS